MTYDSIQMSMSVYKLINSENPDQGKLLRLLNNNDFDAEDFNWGRFLCVSSEDDYVIVHTKNGVYNCERYQYVSKEICKHPFYTHDDLDEDGIVCFYFRIPNDVLGEFESDYEEDK